MYSLVSPRLALMPATAGKLAEHSRAEQNRAGTEATGRRLADMGNEVPLTMNPLRMVLCFGDLVRREYYSPAFTWQVLLRHSISRRVSLCCGANSEALYATFFYVA